MPLERARTLEEAFEAANGAGVAGPEHGRRRTQRDASAGRSTASIPSRIGFDGRLPASWADGWRGWNGWLDAGRISAHRSTRPADRIWTANARVVDGAMLARLGDGSYEVGSRATIVRDRLRDRESFTPRDMLAIQLDARATFLARWRDLILRPPEPRRHRRAMRHGSDSATSSRRTGRGRRAPDSAAYRLTRMFRDQVMDRVISFVLAECYEADPNFDYTLRSQARGRRYGSSCTERPIHLLNPRYGSWTDLFTAAIEAVIDQANREDGGDLSRKHVVRLQPAGFPASALRPPAVLQPLARHAAVDMPGDLFTPRMHWDTTGASERMVVSPGNERTASCTCPPARAGIRCLPFYRNSHDAWAEGEPTPFLPGPTRHTLTLVSVDLRGPVFSRPAAAEGGP